ncbi:MAG TPA: hypothetical protein VEQ35_07745 [Beijerinckia sp.]|jgi:hypothetical protein|nr:hypothetical protein [Beijerinckia sp.]
MMIASRARFFLVLLTTVASIAAAHAARAEETAAAGARAYDGVYVVDLYTDQGSCEKERQVIVAVAGGHVASTNDITVQSSGHIDQRGVVSLAVRRDRDVAHVAGKVNGKSGSGTWSSPTALCGGRWRAERRG